MKSPSPVIAGLGITEMGKVYGLAPAEFAAEAIRRAVDDAGLSLTDIDGLLVSSGISGGVGLSLQRTLQFKDLSLLIEMQAYGSTAGAMIQTAAMAVGAGMARTIVCVFADAPLHPKSGAGMAYNRAKPSGWDGLASAAGVRGANQMYALAARRHMLRYGTTSEQLGHIAVAQRRWATMNPLAQMRTAIISRPVGLPNHCTFSIAALSPTAALP
jgi:acetyl-CoA acetyltransferase